MEPTRFRRLLAGVGNDLSPEQHIELRNHLDRIEADRATDIALGARSRDVASARRCPHCGAVGTVKHGRDKLGRQRFKCRKKVFSGCGSTFNTLTGTPLARMRKPEKWHAFAKALANGFISVDHLHEEGLGVSRLTIWRWRNRFLAAQTARQAQQLSGVVEADEKYFKTSFKGSRGWKRGNPPANRPPRYHGAPAIKRGLSKEQVPILTAVDNSGNIFEARINGLGDIRSTLRDRIEPWLNHLLGRHPELCRARHRHRFRASSDPDAHSQDEGAEAARRQAEAAMPTRSRSGERAPRADEDLRQSYGPGSLDGQPDDLPRVAKNRRSCGVRAGKSTSGRPRGGMSASRSSSSTPK